MGRAAVRTEGVRRHEITRAHTGNKSTHKLAQKKKENKMTAPDKAIEIKAALAAVIAFFTALWGWMGWAVIVWMACIVLDYATGSWAARSAGEWSSAVARAGLWHKLGEIVAVLVAALCDIALGVLIGGAGIDLGIDTSTFLTPIVLLWYIITELGSIIENAGKLGAPVPAWLKKGLEQYREKLEHDKDKNGE